MEQKKPYDPCFVRKLLDLQSMAIGPQHGPDFAELFTLTEKQSGMTSARDLIGRTLRAMIEHLQTTLGAQRVLLYEYGRQIQASIDVAETERALLTEFRWRVHRLEQTLRVVHDWSESGKSSKSPDGVHDLFDRMTKAGLVAETE